MPWWVHCEETYGGEAWQGPYDDSDEAELAAQVVSRSPKFAEVISRARS